MDNRDVELSQYHEKYIKDMVPVIYDHNRTFKLIAYYTENYAHHARNLMDSCKYQKNLDYDIEEMEDLGSWKDNTNFKPRFIRKKLNLYKKPVLYIDVDVVIRSNLEYFDNLSKDYDIGFHYRKGKELLSGTIYLDYNEMIFELLELWINRIEKFPDLWDQKNLQYVINGMNNLSPMKYGLNIINLPARFCTFDLMIRNGEVKENEIEILHFQASRVFNENHPLKGMVGENPTCPWI